MAALKNRRGKPLALRKEPQKGAVGQPACQLLRSPKGNGLRLLSLTLRAGLSSQCWRGALQGNRGGACSQGARGAEPLEQGSALAGAGPGSRSPPSS